MAGIYCGNCGYTNQPSSRHCARCGNRISTIMSTTMSTGISPDVRLSSGRVALVSILSGGLYIFYWFYLTWKQLESETRDQHYPVWHALTLFVPI